MQEGFSRADADVGDPDQRPLWQCDVCRGAFFANGDDPAECPYCAEDEDDVA